MTPWRPRDAGGFGPVIANLLLALVVRDRQQRSCLLGDLEEDRRAIGVDRGQVEACSIQAPRSRR